MNILKATDKNIEKAARIIKNGGIVVFPTETVYGLGADVFNKKAIAKIFEIKERPHFDPLIVHIADKKQLKILSYKIPKKVEKLSEIFWPGPLTIVINKRKSVHDIVTAGLKTVAIRMPANKIALKLIKKAGVPIAAPSANKFTRISPTKAIHVYKQLGNLPDIILDGGKTKIGIESTILKYENGKFYLLRLGGLPIEEIEKKAKIKIYKQKNNNIESPGQFKKHYAPQKETIIVKENQPIKSDLKAAYIGFRKLPLQKFAIEKILSKNGDLKEASANLFDYLHIAENSKKVKKIYIEMAPEIGLGKAINDRIKRAANKL